MLAASAEVCKEVPDVRTLPALVSLLLVLACPAPAEDWPAYLHDNARGGISREALPMPLAPVWTHVPRHAPEPAWPAPAKQDIWHEIRELSPVVVYDRAYHAVSAGDAVYFASSADDQVYCLDAATGEVRWSFFAEGPVRLAPVVDGNRLYFSADDGFAYCLNAADGKLVWRHSPVNPDRRLPGNGRIISHAPARTGVLVENGTVTFFAGLFAPDNVWRCALDAATGRPVLSEGQTSISPQGYLLAAANRVFVPTGRTAPFMFDRDTLEPKGALPGPGGAYAVLADDAVVSGPGRSSGNQLDYADPATGEAVATFPGIRMLVDGNIAYLQSKEEVSALDRGRYLEVSRQLNARNAELRELVKQQKALPKSDTAGQESLAAGIAGLEGTVAGLQKDLEACYLWRKPMANPYSMIMAGDTLFLGGEDSVTGLRASDGEAVWRGETPGKIYGLSAANGRLFASSHLGPIHCFGAAGGEAKTVAPARENPWSPEPLKAAGGAAKHLLEQAGVSKGYALLLGAGDGAFAAELVRQSGLNVVCVESDPAVAETARRSLAAAGLYGARVSVQVVPSGPLPHTTGMMDLVARVPDAPDTAPFTADEAWRVLRPYGGVMCVAGDADALKNWLAAGRAHDAKVRHGDRAFGVKGAPEGAGEWTQLYADSGHTACSMDGVRGPMGVQWFGQPGPRDIVDRHHRPMASLFKNGRLHITGDDKIITVAAHNGFPLWELDVPDSRRVGSMKNAGQMLLADDALYIARGGECWVVDPETGSVEKTLAAPLPEDLAGDWGYLNRDGDLLLGSGQAADASFSELSLATVNMLEGDYRPVVLSRCLFAVDRHSGKKKWLWRGGAVMNSMITVADGRLYFLESRNETALRDAARSGRMRVDRFCKENAWLVALDLKTGKKAWERAVELPFHHIAHLCSSGGVLLASGSYNDGDKLFYGLRAYDTATGRDRWNVDYRGMNIRCTEYSEIGGSHGEQWQHPVIMGDTAFIRPYAFDLATGEKRDYIAYRGGHGCGGLTGSANYLFGRGDVPRMYPVDVASTEGIPLTNVSRPGCWLNIIPAGGIIMIPESSSGCTCAYPLQTSLALAPLEQIGGVFAR